MDISENSRIWIYQSDRILSTDEQIEIQKKLNDFTAQWLAHGNQLTAAGEIRNDRFIILSVDEHQAGATGCSIDKSVNLMKEFEQAFQINLFDRFNITYRDNGIIKSANREEFENLIRSGVVTDDTIVFNNLVETRKQLASHWEIPLHQSWHARVFS